MFKDCKIAFFLAYKSIARGNKAVIFLVVFIMSLAFINLIFVSGILNGFIVTIAKQVKTYYTANIVVNPQEEPIKKDYIIHVNELQEQIESMPGVVATARHYKLAGTLSFDKNKNGKLKFISAEILGIDPDKEKLINNAYQKVVDGYYLDELDRDEILIGAEIAGGEYGGLDFLSLGGVKAGDKINITFGNGIYKTYRVIGILQTNLDFVDMGAYISSKEAESVLSVYNNASQILVKLKDGVSEETENDYQNEIKKLAPNLEIRKWTDYMGSLKDISKSFNSIALMVGIIGLTVAAITIFIMIYINVVNKRRQIGILKAIGIKQNIIILSYIFQAMFYSVLGVIIGLFLIFSLIGPYFIRNPIKLPMGDVGLALENNAVILGIVSLILASVIAGLIPSWNAARENILKAIWG